MLHSPSKSSCNFQQNSFESFLALPTVRDSSIRIKPALTQKCLLFTPSERTELVCQICLTAPSWSTRCVDQTKDFISCNFGPGSTKHVAGHCSLMVSCCFAHFAAFKDPNWFPDFGYQKTFGPELTSCKLGRRGSCFDTEDVQILLLDLERSWGKPVSPHWPAHSFAESQWYKGICLFARTSFTSM